MIPIQRMFPFKMLEVISEIVAIQPCESKVHVVFTLGGKRLNEFFRKSLFLFTQLDMSSVNSGFKTVCSYISIS